jgi:hypothetical protein
MQDEFHIVEVVNRIGEEVERVLGSYTEEKYFEEIMLLYSLIENLLKWSLFVKIFWDRMDKEPNGKELTKLSSFCGDLSFYNALNMGLSLKLIDFTLYNKMDKVRLERNDIIHQLWIYDHRSNPVVLRKTLEKLATVAKQLTSVVSQLTNEIGVEGIYKLKLL